jgi:acetylornithine deacetylase
MHDPAALLCELVAFASPSGREGEIGAFAAERLARGGLDVERLGDTVVARLDLGPGPRLLLNSHLDTVPVGEGWTHPPLGDGWKEGRLYGRGANDAKASVAAMMCAMLELARARSRASAARGEILLALTACEETTNAGMEQALARIGRPDGAVTGEPTGLEVVRAQSGLAVLRAEWSGRSCHAAHVARAPHDSALLRAVAELGSVGPYQTLGEPHPLLGPSTVTPTVMRSGERHNVVPDRAEVLFDCRLAPPQGAREAQALLERKLTSARVEIRSARLSAVETSAEHPLVLAALAASGKAKAIGSSTMSDMALLAGTPAVKCGPGETVRSHTPDEFVLRSEVEAGLAFYLAFAPAALSALAAERSAVRATP